MSFNGTLTGSAPVPVEVMQGVNELTNGLLGIFILILIWAIVYYRNRYEPTRESFAGATWITLLAAVLLRLLGIVTDGHLGVVVVLAIGSLVMLFNRS